VTGGGRWAWAEVDLDAIAHNVGEIRRLSAPSAVWAVVKANGYGHGAVPCAKAALAAGAEGLCVALTEEGLALRVAGIDAPVLVLSQQPPEQFDALATADLTPVLYEPWAVDAFAAAVVRAGRRDQPVHVKVDTGMHRVGASIGDVVALAERVAAAAPTLRLDGLASHLAVADEPEDPFTSLQMQRLDDALASLRAAGIDPPLVHLANSAGALAHPAARRSFVRAGIAIYGIEPGPEVPALALTLRPAMSLRARVSFVRRIGAGERISYGLRHCFDQETTVATLPIGYADGVPRRLAACGGEVLIGGRRRAITGVVTMDQLMVDCGDDDVSAGDEAVLIGEQGGDRIRAEDWAAALDTIGYEIVCGISARVPRRYTGARPTSGEPLGGAR